MNYLRWKLQGMMSRVGVIPYDVWQTWVAIAGLTPGDYADLAAVIASSTARTALTANTTAGKNAMIYMVDSTEVIMPAVLASADFITALDGCAYSVKVPTLSTYVGSNGVASASSELSDQYAWEAFDKNLTTTWATSTSGGSGHWLKYAFTDSVRVYKFIYNVYEFTFKIQYSYDNSSWSDATSTYIGNRTTKNAVFSSAENNCRYWRLYITSGSAFNNINDVDFYGLDLS